MKKKMSIISPMSKFRKSKNQLYELQHTNDQKLGQNLDPMPSSEEIRVQFEKVLQELALPKEKLMALNQLPESKKMAHVTTTKR